MTPWARSPTRCGLLALALVLGAASGCDDGPDPSGADQGAPGTACGAGDGRATIGRGDPFEPAPDLRFPIEQGLQGGHHLDVSVRFVGAIDPDHVDLELDLFDGPRHISRHLAQDWLLYLVDGVDACDYPRARLVLLDEEGGLLPPPHVDGLVGRPLRLEVRLRSAGVEIDDVFTITASEVIRFP